jgi:hypothetical protein
VDDRETPISLHDLFGRIGADSAAIAPAVRRGTHVEHNLVGSILDQVERLPISPQREGSVGVYSGDPQKVSEGFATSLRAMGAKRVAHE